MNNGCTSSVFFFKQKTAYEMRISDWSSDVCSSDLDFAQDHVRILSGLYGLLRPLDLRQPYRLEMGTSWAPGRKKDLYAWWGKSLADALVADLSDDPEPVIVNLASQEYWKAVDRKALGNRRVIDIAFKEQRGGKLVFNSFGAKKARGMM